MKNLRNINVVPFLFFVFLVSQVVAAEIILPKSKPIIDQKTKITTTKKKEIYPEQKPQLIKKKTEITKTKDEIIIFPPKKPLAFKKKTVRSIYKSKLVSQKDFKITKAAFKALEKRKWLTAIKIAKKAKDKTIFKLIYWLYLKEPSNVATFYDYVTFINLNPQYPRISRLKYLAEHKINLNTIPHDFIIKWLGGKDPLSSFGKIKLGEIYIKQKNFEKGSQLIKEGWIKAKLSKSDLKYLKRKYKKIITTKEVIKRADWLAWKGKHWDLGRMLRYLPKDYLNLYRARQLLMSNSYGVDNAINNVPEELKNDIGLQYDRLKWRRRRGRLDPSLEILFNITNDPSKLIRPDIWWKERSILTRSLIYKKKYTLAYKVCSNHSMSKGPEYADAEWLSGWVALTFLEDANLALQHFKNFYNNVGYPISLSRGAYWIGRAYKTMENNQKSQEWFNEATKYLNTYYGQLAFQEIYPEKSFSLNEQPKVEEKYREKFNKNELNKSIKLLNEINKTLYAKDLIKHLAKLNVEKGSEILAGELSVEIGRYDFAIQIAKEASYEKRYYNKLNYPVIEIPSVINNKRMSKPELVLAIIRQESEFDHNANSAVGAKGMMQLMTYTARLVAKTAKMSYSKKKLINNPIYNIKLGSYYLTGLLESYEGSYPFALAAYNAGPKRVKYWKKINGNPQNGKINYVNWIELIKFDETRNYIQRVLENINVYRFMLSGKPIRIYNFFEDKPHY
jgi:soluble lytic murein transglycosylase